MIDHGRVGSRQRAAGRGAAIPQAPIDRPLPTAYCLPRTTRGAAAGFTLLEVLVSVAILGTTMVAVLQLHASTVSLAAKAESMATAARLAKNRMIDLTKAGVPAVESNEGEYEEPELARFTWAERVEESPYSTQLVKVYEISVEVAWGKGPDEVVRIRTYRLQ